MSKHFTNCIAPFRQPKSLSLLSVRALGVIYGDIGTSPLYVLSTLFTSEPSQHNVIGGVSLIIWTLFILVFLKYVIFILSANNHGEGGTLALGALLTGKQSGLSNSRKLLVSILSIVASAFIIGDGALTPAVSVLSAVEGLKTVSSSLEDWVLPITIIIIVLLFLVQQYGTSKIGISFGPIMLLWFISLIVIGAVRTADAPTILKAFNPWEGLDYIIRNGKVGFYALGSVFLAVTGLEALYADLGHFGSAPVRLAWSILVFPSLVMAYLGQGALLINNPQYYTNPFYLGLNKGVYWYIFVLAILATIIESQALITGCFSLVGQGVAMGYFPQVHIKHTSKKIIGQIYIPEVNWMLMILTIAVIAGFRHSSRITQAYGVTVCTVMVLTTFFYICLLRTVKHYPWWRVLPFGIFLIIDLFFLASNYRKIPDGGWVSLLIGGVIAILMLCWFIGQRDLMKALKTHKRLTGKALSELLHNRAFYSPLGSFDSPMLGTTTEGAGRTSNSSSERSSGSSSSEATETRLATSIAGSLDHIQRLPGCGVFINSNKSGVPTSFENVLRSIRGAPELIVFLSIDNLNVPTADPEQRITIKSYNEGMYKVVAHFGYSEYVLDADAIISLAEQKGLPVYPLSTFYFNYEDVCVKKKWSIKYVPLLIYSGMKRIFPGTSNNLSLPINKTIGVGIQIEL